MAGPDARPDLRRPPSHSQRVLAAAFGLVAGVYAWLAFSYLPAGVYWTPDIGLKRIQAANVRWVNGLDLSIAYPGRALDPALRFLPFRENFFYIHAARIYFAQPPLIAVLSAPWLETLGRWGEPVVALLAGLTCVWLTARLAPALDLRPAWPTALIAGLATPLMVYSVFLWEHTLGLALALAAVVAACEGDRAPSVRRAALAGLLAGLAGTVRKELLLLLPVLGMFLIWRRCPGRALSAWAGTAALPVLAWWAFTFAVSGHPVPPEFRISTTPDVNALAYLPATGLGALADFVFDPRSGWLGDGLLGAVLAYGLANRGPRTRLREAIQVAALGAVTIGVLRGLAEPALSGSAFGLLSASPFLVLGWSEPAAGKTRAMRWLMLGYYALTVAALGLTTADGPYLAGLEWGTRYSLLTFALAAPLAARAFGALWARARSGGPGLAVWLARAHLALAGGLLLFSGLWMLTGLSLMRTPAVDAETRDALLQLPQPAVVTNLWWLSAVAPDLYLQRPLYLIDSDAALRDWMEAAQAAGLTGYAFVSYVPLNAATLAPLAPPGVTAQVDRLRPLPNKMVVTDVRLEPLPTPLP